VPLVATLLGALVVAQIGIGAIGVTTGLPAVVRGFHVAGAAAVWATAVVLAALVARLSAPAHVGDTGIEGAALRLPSSDALRG
jgi:heme A synthase